MALSPIESNEAYYAALTELLPQFEPLLRAMAEAGLVAVEALGPDRAQVADVSAERAGVVLWLWPPDNAGPPPVLPRGRSG
jgi:hypothetical protein